MVLDDELENDIGGSSIVANLQILAMMSDSLYDDFDNEEKIIFLEDHTNDKRHIEYYLNHIISKSFFRTVNAVILMDFKYVDKNEVKTFLTEKINIPVLTCKKREILKNNKIVFINKGGRIEIGDVPHESRRV